MPALIPAGLESFTTANMERMNLVELIGIVLSQKELALTRVFLKLR